MLEFEAQQHTLNSCMQRTDKQDLLRNDFRAGSLELLMEYQRHLGGAEADSDIMGVDAEPLTVGMICLTPAPGDDGGYAVVTCPLPNWPPPT